MSQILPVETKKLRACLLCSLVKSFGQFKAIGCENCEEVLQMQRNGERVYECTSSDFDGVIAMMQPSDSWVSRWQRIDRFQPGLYAMRVAGRLPDDIVDALDRRGIQYRPRDISTAAAAI